MTGFTGGCLCGAIRYEVTAEPVRTFCCHCDNCRKATGSSFATNVFVKADDLKITQGTPTLFQHQADSGNMMNKEFCANCGSQLFGSGAARPGMKNIKIGSMDDASSIRPVANLYTKCALPCTHLSDEMENYEEMPDG
ncbi:MAG: GFA family protein [Rhodospirillales bacterium]|jgi:hypothetical protein|nr:GFA family protein [Rhodospirillales bacterium]